MEQTCNIPRFCSFFLSGGLLSICGLNHRFQEFEHNFVASQLVFSGLQREKQFEFIPVLGCESSFHRLCTSHFDIVLSSVSCQ